MVHPAPRMMRAPVKNRIDVVKTSRGEEMGVARGAARRVENRHGKKR
jgi:hypothetical protein